MEYAHDQQYIINRSVKNAVLTVAPAPQAKPAILIDLPGFRMLAQKGEGLRQPGVIGIACLPAMNGSAISQNVKQVSVCCDAEFKPPHEPCGMRHGLLPDCAC
jgi:hypothetical protein